MTKITISEKRRETVKKEFFGFYYIHDKIIQYGGEI